MESHQVDFSEAHEILVEAERLRVRRKRLMEKNRAVLASLKQVLRDDYIRRVRELQAGGAELVLVSPACNTMDLKSFRLVAVPERRCRVTVSQSGKLKIGRTVLIDYWASLMSGTRKLYANGELVPIYADEGARDIIRALKKI